MLMNIAIFTVIKDERDYLDDFLNYHTNMGLHIYVFEDLYSCKHDDICSKYENVFLYSVKELYSEEEMPQLEIDRKLHKPPQTDFINRGLKFIHNLNKYEWCFLIDIDEYITCSEELPKILAKFSNYDAIQIYWKNFGCSGYIYKPIYDNKPIYEIFTEQCGYELYRDLKYSNITKFCVNMKKWSPTMKYKIHNASVNWTKIDYTFNRANIVFEPLYLKHFITKSFEEYCHKVFVRGMFHPGHRNFQSIFEMCPEMKQKVEEDKNFKNYFFQKYGVKLNY